MSQIESLSSDEAENNDKDMVVIEDNNDKNANNSRKRTLSTTTNDLMEYDAKILKSAREELTENEPESDESEEFPNFENFTSLLELQQEIKKLTRSELEAICLEKMYEIKVLENSNAQLDEEIRKICHAVAVLENMSNEVNEQYIDSENTHKKLLEQIQSQKDTDAVQEPLICNVEIQVDISDDEAQQSDSE